MILLHTKCHSSDQIKQNEIGGKRGKYGEKRNAFRVLVGKPEGKMPVGRSRGRWDDNI
jgi:hypothetical protein